MTASVIAVEELTKVYRSTVAVDGLSFEVRGGAVTGFLGPNGAGKTTTIRMILGLARADSGEASVFGRPYRGLERPLSKVGVLIDGSGFHPRRSARAHLTAVAAAGAIPRGRVDKVLDAVELNDAEDRNVGEFSLGMRQRLGLATALLGDPDVLILDEPANGLDPAGIRWLRGFLKSFAAAGRSVFVSSHVLSEVAQMADEVVVIDRGKLITHTSVDRLTAPTSVTVRAPEAERLRRLLSGAGATVNKLGEDRLEVVGMTSEEVGETAARKQLILYELTPRTHSLEEVFLQLTDGREARDDSAA